VGGSADHTGGEGVYAARDVDSEGRIDMSDRYTYSITDTSVSIGFEGKPGSITFGVGGPVAARNVAGLIDEINTLKNTLESVVTHDAFAAELTAYRDLLTSIRETRHLADHAYPKHVKAALELCEEQLAATQAKEG
jgi:hypothetical protein